MHFFRGLIALLIFFCLFSPAYPIIVWEGKIVPEWPDQLQGRLAKRSESSGSLSTDGLGFYPNPKGTIYGLTMIVDFSDQPAVFTEQQVTDWLNKPGFSMGGTRGSVRDYFYECSNGQVDLQNHVVGYYRAKKPKSYYDNASGYETAAELVKELIEFWDASVDFSKYDNDSNGTTEAISIVYAGSGQTWGKGLWPHAGSVGIKKDGVTIGRYNMCDMGTNLSLYVFCHETGHMVFGWPDLYWFGDYCLMGNRMSDVNPQAINDFFRADQGWIPCETVNASDNKSFKAWHNGNGYLYVNPAKKTEMLFWSVITNTGRWSNIKGRGVLLYHFDYSIRSNSSATRRCLYVVEADGNNAMAAQQWPNPGSSSKDFFYKGNNDEFSPSSNPASYWGLKISNISEPGDTMYFDVGTGSVNISLAKDNRTLYEHEIQRKNAVFDILGRIKSNSGTEVKKTAGVYLMLNDGYNGYIGKEVMLLGE